jgi:hypothetical protein
LFGSVLYQDAGFILEPVPNLIRVESPEFCEFSWLEMSLVKYWRQNTSTTPIGAAG